MVIKSFLTLIILLNLSVAPAHAYVQSATGQKTRIVAHTYNYTGTAKVAFDVECLEYKKNSYGNPERYFKHCHTYGHYDLEKVEAYLKKIGVSSELLLEQLAALKSTAEFGGKAADATLISLLGGPVTFTVAWLVTVGANIKYGSQEEFVLDTFHPMAVLMETGRDVVLDVDFKKYEAKLIKSINSMQNGGDEPEYRENLEKIKTQLAQ